ncbi:MAG: transposase [Selenomonadaceae bacterium]|nr:transposase [Selenomonadaceae bacterium]
MKTFCFKLYQSERNGKLHKQINAAGLIFNHCIALHKRYYRLYHKFLHANKLKKHLTKLKKIFKFRYLLEIGSQSVQDIAERIDRAYQLFFRNLKRKIRCSPPNFKKVRRYKSFTLKQAGWKLDESTYTLKINGQNYRYFQSRRIIGEIRTITIKRDNLGDIYVYIVTDATDFEIKARTGNRVGFDFGLKKFLTASDGFDVESPMFFAQNSKLIKQDCRNLSRKIKGSNNRRRARLKLARLYKKSANQRHDFHFKLAHKLCIEYDVICIEDLSIKAMQRLYGRKIGDLAFSDFVNILKYEASKFDTEIIEVNRFYASSQICSECGYKNSETKDLSVREWKCPECGAEHDRDRNAAINILKYGLGQRPKQETL